MRESNEMSRRQALRIVGTGVVGAAGFGSQTAFAEGEPHTGEIRKFLHTFDPSKPAQVEEAVGHLLLIDTRREAENILFSLSADRQAALKQAIQNFVGLEFQAGDQLVEQSDDDVQAAGSKTRHCKGVLKNATFGTTEAIFDHFVYWEFDGNQISNFSHWKEVETPGWLTYWNGVTTDYIDDRGDHGVSRMAGEFEACVTNWGCYTSTRVGSSIWVYANGDWACNPWDDEFES